MNHRLRSGQSRREAIKLLGIIGSLDKNMAASEPKREQSHLREDSLREATTIRPQTIEQPDPSPGHNT